MNVPLSQKITVCVCVCVSKGQGGLTGHLYLGSTNMLLLEEKLMVGIADLNGVQVNLEREKVRPGLQIHSLSIPNHNP